MDFQYLYIIQDIVGILIFLLGIKFAFIYGLMIKRKGFRMDYLLSIIGNLMLTTSGGVLVLSYFSFEAWARSVFFFLLAWIIGLILKKKWSAQF